MIVTGDVFVYVLIIVATESMTARLDPTGQHKE